MRRHGAGLLCGVEHLAAAVGALGDSLVRPHEATRLLMKAKPRRTLVRKLNALGGFPADFRYGPAIHMVDGRCASTMQDNEEDYGSYIATIEQALSDICGHDDKAATMHQGSSEGSKSAWKPVGGISHKTGATRRRSRGPRDRWQIRWATSEERRVRMLRGKLTG